MQLLKAAVGAFVTLALLCLLNAQTNPSLDFEAHKALAETIIAAVNNEQFDLLESQYRDLKFH
jgi:hypothetical protein